MSAKTRAIALGGLLSLALLSVSGVEGGGPQTFTVNSVDDSYDGTCGSALGGCTLRDATVFANNSPEHDTINFDPDVFPPGNPESIIPLTPPFAFEAAYGITVDGTGAGVEILGFEVSENGTDGMLFASGVSPATERRDIVVRNILIENFPGAGIRVACGGTPCPSRTTNVEIDNVTSTLNTRQGLHIDGLDVSQVTITDSVFSNNLMSGVRIEGVDSVEHVEVSGSTFANNVAENLLVISGGATSGLDVLENISLAPAVGIYLESAAGLSDVQVRGNFVGPGTQEGIYVTNGGGSSNVVIADNDVIQSNDDGIYYNSESPTSNVVIEGNTLAGNLDRSITWSATQGTLPNVIRDNEVTDSGDNGIFVQEPTARVVISRNSISGSEEIGIDLGLPADPTLGVTPNDPGDGDTGPNELLNFPVIQGSDGQHVTGEACAGCTVELFISDDNPSGYGEGESFVADAISDGSGMFAVPICDLAILPGVKLTATATHPDGYTSEFSLNYTLSAGSGPCPSTPTPTPIPTPTTTPTPTLTSTATVSPEPSESAVPTPTGTPSVEAAQGDVDCDGDEDSVDALKVLRDVASLPVQQTEPCDDIGASLARAGSAGKLTLIGDVDCDDDVDSVDALKILRHVASLPVAQTEPCRDIGT